MCEAGFGSRRRAGTGEPRDPETYCTTPRGTGEASADIFKALFFLKKVYLF